MQCYATTILPMNVSKDKQDKIVQREGDDEATYCENRNQTVNLQLPNAINFTF